LKKDLTADLFAEPGAPRGMPQGARRFATVEFFSSSTRESVRSRGLNDRLPSSIHFAWHGPL
jgi:hypothetical protein